LRVLKPPAPLDVRADERAIFLAGSIEMGKATDWQAKIATALAARDGVILNPRREAWDSTWAQSITDARFREQVVWELDGLDRADVIAVWFAPDTKAPITLLELGLHVRSGRLVVGCPDGYWRKGNIEVVCDRFEATLCHDWMSFLVAVDRKLGARAAHEGCWCTVLGERQHTIEKSVDDRNPFADVLAALTLVRECDRTKEIEHGIQFPRGRTLYRCTCGAQFVFEWDYEYLANGSEDERCLVRISEELASQLP
jgi:hypothetical protein